MNQTIETLINRVSTKKYLSKQVPDDVLDIILEAGLHAPSGMHNQNIYAVAVRDQETRDLLSRLNASVMGAENDPFYGAPCVVVVLSDPECRTWVENGSLMLGNMLNAATALGIGSCWIHRAKEVFDMPEGKLLLKKWGLPETLRGVGNCILGYPDGTPVPKPRAEDRIIKVD